MAAEYLSLYRACLRGGAARRHDVRAVHPCTSSSCTSIPVRSYPALAPYRVAYWIGLAGAGRRDRARFSGEKTGRVANLQLWGVVVFTAVMGVSLMVAERWLGAPILAMQRFGPSSDDLRARNLQRDVDRSAANRRRLRRGADDDTHAPGRGRLPSRLQHAGSSCSIGRRASEDPSGGTAEDAGGCPTSVDQVPDDADDADGRRRGVRSSAYPRAWVHERSERSRRWA